MLPDSVLYSGVKYISESQWYKIGRISKLTVLITHLMRKSWKSLETARDVSKIVHVVCKYHN